MRSKLCLSLCGLLLLVGPALAKKIYIPPAPVRLATAKVAVIGTVTMIEKDSVRTTYSPTQPQQIEYQVALVKVSDALVGAKGLTHVRVGIRSSSIRVGQEGCFVLAPHHKETFFVMSDPHRGFVAKKDDPAGFAAAQRCGKLLADPSASLKSKSADDRFVTAAMLITRYRTKPAGAHKLEPIDAAESKLILEALRDADWNRRAPDQLNVQRIFSQLGLTAKDGWQQPRVFNQTPAAAKAWLTKHAGSYRIQRFVSAKK